LLCCCCCDSLSSYPYATKYTLLQAILRYFMLFFASPRYDTLRYASHPLRHGTIRYKTLRHATIRYDTLRHATIRYDTLRYATIRYDTLRHATTRYDTLPTRYRHATDTLPTRYRHATDTTLMCCSSTKEDSSPSGCLCALARHFKTEPTETVALCFGFPKTPCRRAEGIAVHLSR
jgi:hypothetical protein